MGLSRERVRQIEEALMRLRENSSTDLMQDSQSDPRVSSYNINFEIQEASFEVFFFFLCTRKPFQTCQKLGFFFADHQRRCNGKYFCMDSCR